MIIYKYDLDYYEKPVKYSHHEDKFTVEELTPLAENDKYIIFNDWFFTKIEKSGDGYCHNVLNRPAIHFKDCLSAKGIFYTLYSTRKTRIDTIERQIRDKAEKEYGYLFAKKLKLSILKLGKEAA